MLENSWGIMPVVLWVYFSYIFYRRNYQLNYFKYILFALYPYIISNASAASLYKDLTHALSLIVILIFLYEVWRKKLYVSKLLLAYVVFIFYVTFSGALIYPDSNYFIGTRNIIVFSLTVLALYYRGEEHLDELKHVAQINTVVMSLCGIFQFFIEYSAAYTYLYTTLRVTAFTRNANTYAEIVLIYLFFVLVNGSFKENIKYYIFAMVAVILSGSISGTMGFLVLCLNFRKYRECLRRLIGLFVIGSLIFMAILIVIRWQNPDYFNGLFKSQSDRMSLWALYLNAFQENPFWGQGWGTLYPRMSKYLYNMPVNAYTDYIIHVLVMEGAGVAVHNDLIKLLAETGLVGTMLCIVFIYQAYSACYKKKAIWHIKILTVGIGFFLTQNIIQNYDFWLFFFIPLLLHRYDVPTEKKINYDKMTISKEHPCNKEITPIE